MSSDEGMPMCEEENMEQFYAGAYFDYVNQLKEENKSILQSINSEFEYLLSFLDLEEEITNFISRSFYGVSIEEAVNRAKAYATMSPKRQSYMIFELVFKEIYNFKQAEIETAKLDQECPF